jgi:phage head maturation protease
MGKVPAETKSFVRREMSMASTPDVLSRRRSFVASSETVDRYNTIIKAAGWDLAAYNRNGVVLFGHDSRALPIGKGVARVEGTQLILDVDFFDESTNPVAEQSLRILDAGVMGVSVGFRALEAIENNSRLTGDKWKDMFEPPLDFLRSELLEVSVVPIPANPDALPIGRSLQEIRSMAERLVRADKAAPATEPTCTGCPVHCADATSEEAAEPAPQIEVEINLSAPELKAMVARIVAEESRAALAAKTRERLGQTSRGES